MAYVTNYRFNDGFGAQYQRIVFSIIFAELSNSEFVYRPFESMDHNYDNDPSFIENKEKFINIRGNFKSITEVDEGLVTSLGIRVPQVEGNLDHCLSLPSLQKVKDLLHANKECSYDKSYTNIAVHVRKPNPHDIGDYGYYPDDYYLNAISVIRSTYPNQKIFHIYSQGDLQEFVQYMADDVVLHINEPIEKTFYDLVTSDILVMSKGSFSYIAAILSDGIVYYLPFWHPKASKWMTL